MFSRIVTRLHDNLMLRRRRRDDFARPAPKEGCQKGCRGSELRDTPVAWRTLPETSLEFGIPQGLSLRFGLGERWRDALQGTWVIVYANVADELDTFGQGLFHLRGDGIALSHA